jgi:hypothetical protein
MGNFGQSFVKGGDFSVRQSAYGRAIYRFTRFLAHPHEIVADAPIVKAPKALID